MAKSFIALILFLSSKVTALTVNVVVSEANGGYGDVASNLLMAIKLKELLPEADINLVGPKR